MTVPEVIEDIGSHTAAKTKEIDSAPVTDKVVKIDARKFGKSVFCVPGLGRLDDCVALVVADILKREGFNARISGVDTEIDNADTVCVCFIEEVSTGRAAFTARKFSRRTAVANVVICQLGNAERKGFRQGRRGGASILGRDRCGSRQKYRIEGSKGTIASR